MAASEANRRTPSPVTDATESRINQGPADTLWGVLDEYEGEMSQVTIEFGGDRLYPKDTHVHPPRAKCVCGGQVSTCVKWAYCPWCGGTLNYPPNMSELLKTRTTRLFVDVKVEHHKAIGEFIKSLEAQP